MKNTKFIISIVYFLLLICPFCYGTICVTCEGGGGGGGGAVVTCDNTKTILYVDESRPDNTGNGYTWGTAKKTLHAALYIANRCPDITRVHVAKGTYRSSTTATLSNRDNNFFIGESYSLFGGYPTGGGVRDHVNNPTILDGEIADGFEAYHVMVIYGVTGSVTIDGFQIKNGFGDGAGSIDLGSGVLMNRNNGGGIYIRGSSDVTFRNCAVYQNIASNNGGGIFNFGSNLTLVNTVFALNTAVNGGALLNVEISVATITNATFAGNIAYTSGGAAYTASGSSIIIKNTIVWGNTLLWGGGGSRSISYSLVQDGTTANNCLNVDPAFNNAGNLDGADNKWFTTDDGLAIPFCSPAVNRGNNTATPSPTNDIADNPRNFNFQIDMGAYENQAIPYPLAPGQRSISDDQCDNYVYGGITAFGVPGCRIIAHVTPNGTSPVQGMLMARTTIQGVDLIYNGQPFVNRHYQVRPTTNDNEATARLTLFFSNGEFTNFNQRAEAAAKLPTTDGLNKQDLRIVQYHGDADHGSEPGDYPGKVTVIDPEDADIVWSQNSLTWRVSFDVTGFSGFFLTAVARYRFSGTGDWNDASKWDNGKIPPSTLPSFCEIIIAEASNCVLNVPQNISKNGALTIEPNAHLQIQGNLTIDGIPMPM